VKEVTFLVRFKLPLDLPLAKADFFVQNAIEEAWNFNKVEDRIDVHAKRLSGVLRLAGDTEIEAEEGK
jgi:hypothetical protein